MNTLLAKMLPIGGKAATALVFAVAAGVLSPSLAYADRDGDGRGGYGDGRGYGGDGRDRDHREWRGHDRDDYRGGNRGYYPPQGAYPQPYGYAQPVYAPPPVYAAPRPSPGISLFVPLNVHL